MLNGTKLRKIVMFKKQKINFKREKNGKFQLIKRRRKMRPNYLKSKFL